MCRIDLYLNIVSYDCILLHPTSDINNVNMVHYYVIVQLNVDMQDTYVDMQHNLSGMFT